MTATTERVYETREIEINPSSVEAGDYIWSVTFKVEKDTQITVGTKWVYISNKSGTLTHKFPRYENIKVQRKFETNESREARRRADENAMLRKIAERGFDLETENKKALDEFIKQHGEWGSTHYGHLDSLLTTEAFNLAQARFISALQYKLEDDPDADLIAFKDEYIQDLEHSAIDRIRLTSRSTSRTSNLIDDFALEAVGKLSNEIQWMMIRADRG